MVHLLDRFKRTAKGGHSIEDWCGPHRGDRDKIAVHFSNRCREERPRKSRIGGPMRKILLLVAAAVPFSFGAYAGEGEKCTAKCDKDSAKCCLESANKVALTQEKAEALAKAIKSEGCPVKSGEILASVLPGLQCKETLAKLTADIKAKECSGEAASLILAAAKQYGAPEKKAI